MELPSQKFAYKNYRPWSVILVATLICESAVSSISPQNAILTISIYWVQLLHLLGPAFIGSSPAYTMIQNISYIREKDPNQSYHEGESGVKTPVVILGELHDADGDGITY